MEVVCFHNPDEENGYLSNWYLSEFCIENIMFSSMEQYMMYKKATVFHDEIIAREILEQDNVVEIKKLGRSVSGYNDNYWNGVRQIIVYNGLKEKFSQDMELKSRLLGTGQAIIAECAVRDRIWEIGWSMKAPERLEPEKWKGYNLLGYTLMMVREHIV